MENRILVTGATGNIGKEVVKLLKAENADFITGTTKGETIEGIKTVKADFSDKESLIKAMQGITTLFMLSPSHPESVQWGEHVIDAAKESGVKFIVRSSGSFADINSDLLIEKLLGTTDKYLKDSGINYTITAPSSFMQNFSTTMAADYNSGTIYHAAGDADISWTDVRDIAAVNVKVLLNPEKYQNQTLTITGSESFNYEEAVKQMNEVLGKETKYVSIPNEAAAQAMADMHFPQFIIDLLISLNDSIKQGHFIKTTDTIKKVLGRKPNTFRQFITDNKDVWI